MAIYHLSMKPVTRASGRSAVAAAAYRSGTRLTNERDGLTHDYTRKGGIEHSEIVLPEGSTASWAVDREALWNAAEFAEKRKDARVAREFEVALPHELTGEQRLELTREFSRSLANRFGAAVDFSLHTPDREMDVRNHHAHILMTTRQVDESGLGDKTMLERENKWLLANDLPLSQTQLKDLRLEWEELTNQHLARAGHDLRVDHRSHEDRGLSIEPTQHVGVHAHQMEQRGKDVERVRLEEEARRRNAELIREDPNQVLTILTGEKSVFDRRDIARTLHRYINDDPAEYQALFDRVMASDQLIKLTDGKGRGGRADVGREGGGSAASGPRYSTREMVELETGMVSAAAAMAERQSHGVDGRHVSAAIGHQDQAIQRSLNADLIFAQERGAISVDAAKQRWKVAGLSPEQVGAVEHVTGAQQMAVVVGYAGAGKSTMLAAAREAWEAQGYTVHGAALAGKAAEGLEESSGIQSRTLASWDMRMQMGSVQLGARDVFVIDEAGMIGSRQLFRFVTEAKARGAKVVLVGDQEQLQAIGAGAAFRSIAEEVGFVSLQDVRRQRQDWQREASVAFASQRTGEGLSAYQERGAVHLEADTDTARASIVREYVEDLEARPGGSRAAMAHRRADVHALNVDIRSVLQEKGLLPGRIHPAVGDTERAISGGRDAVEVSYGTDNGVRSFVAGDRIVFLQNDSKLGVKNGMLGTVERVEEGRLIARADGRGKVVDLDTTDYKAFDHGYATTIHKTQGATVDRAFVLASKTMDRHMTYVAMTRHRDEAQLYAGQDQFDDIEHLKTRLGRSGGKETVLDYVGIDGRRLDTGEATLGAQVNAFAQRRGIDSEIVWPVERQKVRRREKDRGGAEGQELAGPAPIQVHQRRGDPGPEEPGQVENGVGNDQRQGLDRGDGGDLTPTAGPKVKRGIFSGLKFWKRREPDNEAVDREGPAEPRDHDGGADRPTEGAIDAGPSAGHAKAEKDERGKAVDVGSLAPDPAVGGGATDPGQETFPRELAQNKVEVRRSNEHVPDPPGTSGPDAVRARFEAALGGYLEAGDVLLAAKARGLAPPADEVRAMRQAAKAMDEIRPGSEGLLLSAMKNDRSTAGALRELRGDERVQKVLYGIAKEDQRQRGQETASQAQGSELDHDNPSVRAKRILDRWKELGQAQDKAERFGDRARINRDMRQLVQDVKDDPQVEKVLADRARAQGMDLKGQTMAQVMERQISQRERDRDRGLER